MGLARVAVARGRRAAPWLVALVVLLAGCGGEADPPKPAATPTSTVSDRWTAANANLANARRVSGPIDSASVGRLREAWTLPIGAYVATPIVAGSVLYTQDRDSNVYAIDLRGGTPIWRRAYHDPDMGPNGVTLGADGRLYGATSTFAFALSARTGRELWRRRIVRNRWEGIDMAPGYWHGLVYLSTSALRVEVGYHAGARGVLWAIDGRTGRTAWTWSEVPVGLWGHPGVNSGGGMWQPPAFDGYGHLYASVSNPGPVMGAGFPREDSRPGANKWTNSVVKLDARTGRMSWGTQVLAHDIFNWDLSAASVLAETDGRGVVLTAGKMGYVYALDRETGALLWKAPVGRHNGHDHDGLKMAHGGTAAFDFPMRVMPGQLAGILSPLAVDRDTVYAPTNDLFTEYYSATSAGLQELEAGSSAMVALDLASGHVRWRHAFGSPMYGAASVANDLVFTTTYDGDVWALRTRDGSIAWHARLPAATNAPVAISGGMAITAASLKLRAGQRTRLIAYRLAPRETGSRSGGGARRGGTAAPPGAAGRSIFAARCAGCHTLADAHAAGVGGPDLDRLRPDRATVQRQVTTGGGGMPAFRGQLSARQIAALARYVARVAGQ